MTNIIALKIDPTTDWQKDLDEFEAALAKTKPFSGEKGHLLELLMETAKNKKLPAEIRHRACSLVWTYSEVRQFLSSQLISCHQCDHENTRWSAEAMKNWVVK
tara:strand:- start:248 stop:556 length:309 start_codon:yes stop_codon:yes gene_type:complete